MKIYVCVCVESEPQNMAINNVNHGKWVLIACQNATPKLVGFFKEGRASST